ncbi:MAG: hypothetical protein K0R38_6767, partial [Polyangiaceae bacterium]|nr:hypothetical protein [Polyangiaceae bacterium]
PTPVPPKSKMRFQGSFALSFTHAAIVVAVAFLNGPAGTVTWVVGSNPPDSEIAAPLRPCGAHAATLSAPFSRLPEESRIVSPSPASKLYSSTGPMCGPVVSPPSPPAPVSAPPAPALTAGSPPFSLGCPP